jgi:hypothetical protein
MGRRARDAVPEVRTKYEFLRDVFDERTRRLWAAAEARALGHGGTRAVAEATGMARSTIYLGQKELDGGRLDELGGRVRRPGGGRKALTERDPDLVPALDALVEPTTRGDPMSPLRWTCKSTRKLAAELTAQGHKVGHTVVAELLAEMGYSLQATQKAKEGRSHADRDGQFEHLNAQVKSFQRAEQPVISVDTKKKELVGDFANKGREYQPEGQPERVRVHDFIDKDLGKAIPYGVYDVARNVGWVSVGIDHDTAQFAVEAIRRWWRTMGSLAYPGASKLLVTADGGGSNASRSRLWKVELQTLADEIGLAITVCHLPPGTSKWNKIEHRLFSHISQNWRGRPLVSHETVVNLIANTTTSTGLKVRAKLDRGSYPLKVTVSDEELEAVRLKRHSFHGEWNYTIRPRMQRR